MKEMIQNFIINEILEKPDFQLPFDEPIIEHSIIDSTEILKIVLFVEENFDIRVENDEITLENFGSINQINDFVEEKKNREM